MKKYEYKTVNLFLTPMDSEVSQFEIDKKCNEMGQAGWELVRFEIYNEMHIMLIFLMKNLNYFYFYQQLFFLL